MQLLATNSQKLSDKINISAETVVNNKANLRNEIIVKGGSVPSNNPTFQELINGIKSITTIPESFDVSYSNFRGEEYGQTYNVYFKKPHLAEMKDSLNTSVFCTGRYIYYLMKNEEENHVFTRYDFLLDVETTLGTYSLFNKESISLVLYNSDIAIYYGETSNVKYIFNLSNGETTQITFDFAKMPIMYVMTADKENLCSFSSVGNSNYKYNFNVSTKTFTKAEKYNMNSEFHRSRGAIKEISSNKYLYARQPHESRPGGNDVLRKDKIHDLMVFDWSANTFTNYARFSCDVLPRKGDNYEYNPIFFMENHNFVFVEGCIFEYSSDFLSVTEIMKGTTGEYFCAEFVQTTDKITFLTKNVPGAWYNDGVFYGRSLDYLYVLKQNPEYQIPVIPNCIARFNKKVINGGTEVAENTDFVTSQTVITKENSISGTLTIPTGKVIS